MIGTALGRGPQAWRSWPLDEADATSSSTVLSLPALLDSLPDRLTGAISG
jgi:hypothetical protein